VIAGVNVEALGVHASSLSFGRISGMIVGISSARTLCFFYDGVLVLHMFIEAEVVGVVFQHIRVISACQKNPRLGLNTQIVSRQTMYSWDKSQ
jgi:hypothetical protein